MTQTLQQPALQALLSEHARLVQAHAELSSRGLAINMARGIPSPEQLDLSSPMLTLPDYFAEDGTDCRNYMGLQGLPEARALFAPLVGVPASQVVIGGNSSLAMMYDMLAAAMRVGVPGGQEPWSRHPEGIAFLCPTPGYDRHFSIASSLGIRLIPVPLGDDGPDMTHVEVLVKDPAVKGMWCVPKYSNPTGAIYSDAVIERLSGMRTAAPDFRLFWDDAYGSHPLTEDEAEIANVVQRCMQHGNTDRALVFTSTSKMTFAGAGLAIFGSSPCNVDWWLRQMEVRSAGPDKLNQLRHVRFLRSLQGIKTHMHKHRAILAPRFQAVLSVFNELLGGRGVAQWNSPKGGYFISVQVTPGTAARVGELAAACGITITRVGACFVHGHDPYDSHLRIAPSSLDLAQIDVAARVIAASILLSASEQAIERNTLQHN